MVSFDLTQLIGLYFLIGGLIVVTRRAAFMPGIKQLVANRPMLIIVGMVELFAGLAIVLAYPTVGFSSDGVLSLVGWMLVVESVLYFLLPSRDVQQFMKRFTTPNWYLAGGLISILLGSYLVGIGFAIIR